MALVVPPSNDKKRVKVYELRNNDWFDRGTGFCTGRVINDESKVCVESEDQPDRTLLETKISKDDRYQKQQDTLIVWTEATGTDMALSFQEAEGCALIWDFVSQVQQHLLTLGGPDDSLSDDATESFANPLVLPAPELRYLDDIEHTMRGAVSNPQGRDALSKFIIGEDYIRKLIPLVSMAEDFESIEDLHHLCNIMKMLILLNDTQIIEQVVSDGLVDGVVGALEFDPEFPTQKANHRRYLRDASRYKEVVPIADVNIRRKIHATWRLQYLKDVILARILDDPTFSVLNSLIFFNQVDIVTYIQGNPAFLEELFGIIDSSDTALKRKKDAIGFIQQCCAIAKNLQAPARAILYSNFIQNGLLHVVTFALLDGDPSIRVAGTDILVAMIDHDPGMVRSYIFKAIGENKTPLTETLIELLLVEVDLGVKAQAADAIKVLLEPQTNQAPPDNVAKANGEFMSKLRSTAPASATTENFIQSFYDGSANRLFQPLKDLEGKKSLHDLTLQEVSLFHHLIEILHFLIRQHLFRSKYFIFSEGLAARIAQLLSCPQKHLKLSALKFFRCCIGLQDDFYNRQMTQHHYFAPILQIVYDTMPRDNLLNSACLEFFEFIKRENIKPIILHLVENYRERLQPITYVDTFQALILRYDQMQDFNPEMDTTLFSNDGGSTPNRHSKVNGNNTRWQGVKEMDAAEEAYFNTSDEEDEMTSRKKPLQNGASPPSSLLKSLVDYPDDDEDAMDTNKPAPLSGPSTPQPSSHKPDPRNQDASSSSSSPAPASPTPSTSTSGPSTPLVATPPERLSEKRRREEDDEEDELGKLSVTKRRSSSVGATSLAGHTLLRRKKGFAIGAAGKDSSPTGMGGGGGGGKKIEISFGVKPSHAAGDGKRDEGG